MNHTQTASARSSTSARHPRPRTATTPVALPSSRSETLALCELLEANLQALHVLHEEHRRMLAMRLGTIDGACTELRSDLRAIGDPRAPWVAALSETRALLFVALRELIVGAGEAERTVRMPQQEPADPHPRTR